MIELHPWMDDAACKDEPPDTFFPPSEGNRQDTPDHPMWERGKAICAGCPVVDDCLAYAVRNEKYGLWGGLTPAERSALRTLHGVDARRWPTHYVRRNKGAS